MSSSSSPPSIEQPTNDTMVPIGIMVATWAFLIGVISAILLTIGYFSQSSSASQTWSAGLYLLGGAAILALFAYVDVVSLDRGRPSSAKSD